MFVAVAVRVRGGVAVALDFGVLVLVPVGEGVYVVVGGRVGNTVTVHVGEGTATDGVGVGTVSLAHALNRWGIPNSVKTKRM